MMKWPMAGCVDARHGMAALCMALGGGLLTAVGLMTGGCSGAGAGQVLNAGYAAVLATQDRNADGALDRGEVAAMVERAIPPERRTGQNWAALRAWLIAGYMEQDANRDGRLTLGELLRGGPGVCGAGMPCPGAAPGDEGPDMSPANRTGEY